MNPYEALERRWKALRGKGIAVREVACAGAPRTLLCAETGETGAPLITIAAGVHGDEPAGVYALAALVENGLLDSRFAYRLWPCTNPTGFAAGTRASAEGCDVNRTFGRGGGSPEARAILTANRDRRFELAIDLHEDDEASAFYCYEYGAGGIGAAAVAAAGGTTLLAPDPAEEARLIGGFSLSLLLARRAARRALTLESAASEPIDRRIARHVAAVQAGVAALSQTLR